MEKRNNRPFGYGPLFLLMGACLAVMAAIVLTLVSTDSSDRENANIEGMTTAIAAENSVSGNDARVGMEKQPAEASDEVNQEETVPENRPAEVLDSESSSGAETVPETYEFTVSDKSYFDDALFIGDSRTAGLQKYGTLDNADYFASPGLNLYTIDSTRVEVEE